MMINPNTTIESLNKLGILSVRATNVCNCAGIKTLGQLLAIDDLELVNLKKCGRRTIEEFYEIRQKYSIQFSQYQLNTENKQPGSEENVELKEAFKKCSMLSYASQDKLNKWIQWRYNHLSVRAKNVFPRYNKLEVVIQEIYTNGGINLSTIKNCGKKTTLEIKEFFKDVRQYFEDITNNPENKAGLLVDNKTELEVVEIGNAYPFLLTKECESIIEFKSQNGSYPYLYIIKMYILRSDENNVRLYRDFYGLNIDQTQYSLADIANVCDLSRERIRQIVCGSIPLPESLQIYVSQQLSKEVDDIVSFDSSSWKELQRKNMLQESYAQTALLVCALLESHMVVQFDKNTTKYLVKRAIIKGLKLRSILKDICRVLDIKRTKIEVIDICQFIKMDNCNCDNQAEKLCPIYADYIKYRYKLEIRNNRFVIALPNFFDISSAIEEILEQKGKPMSLVDLYVTFNQLYPNSYIDTLAKFKSYLFKNIHIKPKGKTGIYTLDKWKNCFTGTIVDYIENVLRTFNEPVLLGSLVEFVQEEFPRTNRKSIYSLITSDKNKRFVVYEDDFIGLVNSSQLGLELKERRIIKRTSFDTHFVKLKDFIINHKRIPIMAGSEEEQSLARWIVNVLKRNIDISDEQLKSLQSLLQENKDLPQTGLEYRFQQMCDRIKVYVHQNFSLPTFANNPSEYAWLRKNREKYKTYSDNRKKYFEGLLLYLQDFGFYL